MSAVIASWDAPKFEHQDPTDPDGKSADAKAA